MRLLIYHGPEPRKPLVAIAEVEWEGATLGVGTIDLNATFLPPRAHHYRCERALAQRLFESISSGLPSLTGLAGFVAFDTHR